MKTTSTISKIVLSASVVLLVLGCSSKKQSPTTGWNYDDPKWGGFESAKNSEQGTPPGMTFIEGGTFIMGRTMDNIKYEWDNQPRKVTVSSFYMDECEVTNEAYREYLYWLQRVYKDNPEVYQRSLPDTLVWRNKLSYNEPMTEYYFRNPSWANYPVVGVTWLQANDYCAWRTDRLNERTLIQEGYLDFDQEQQGDNVFTTDAYLAGQYEGLTTKKEVKDLDPNSEGTRKVKMEDGILWPKFRLPTEAEWEYAALGLVGNTTKEGRILERRIYPWNGHVVRTDQKKYYGEMLANFKRSRGDAMGIASALNDHWEYTAPVNYYFPNDYGLYNMAGNVSEWVMDVYRPNTTNDANDINPYRGNVYITKVLDSDGMIAEKDSLGRITYREVTVEDNINRRNYRQADNINYLDGDLSSQLSDTWKKTETTGEEAATAEEDNTQKEQGSNNMYEYGKTSMINDKARVVKGGSWKDEALYLSPGEKRYLDQSQSTDWIGFRCAMDRLGSREKRK
ncbi:MAG: SUMF1/EgtB/PvdO family nonheme iron enzyme [Bacteroidales bacterium]|jgi:sulfatase modifying factor 1|nr:SUMF1/EgtB/PvdO family nonheme iron enzyme [Bacteroidales bacterium]